MSNPGSLQAINKIHINNSTKMTLSDRFTAFSAQPKILPRTSRRGIESPINNATSIANRRLLKQLAQKHTREAALKLKRRSLKARTPTSTAYTRVTNGVPLKRGSIKALRLGPSGRLMKANSITNVATMEADFLGRPPRRSNSTSRIAERIGGRRHEGPGGGGLPRRTGRPVWRLNPQMNFDRMPPPPRMRSRSRSRTRRVALSPASSQPGIGQRMTANRPVRSNSRPRTLIRSRSRSSRTDRMMRLMEMRGSENGSVKSRLGMRPSPGAPKRARSISRGRAVGRLLRQGVATGRIQRRGNPTKSFSARGASVAGSVQNRISRARGRGNAGTVSGRRARSRSRTDNRPFQRNNSKARSGSMNRLRGQSTRGRGGRGAARGSRLRGRSQQRGAAQRNANGQQQQQQQRRGRSRSRGRGSARGGRQLGKDRPDVKKEDLDKELDQYMSSTKATDGGFS